MCFNYGFASLVSITSSAVGLKICVIIAGIKLYKSIIKKSREKHDKMVLLAKYQLDPTELLNFKALIDSSFTHDDFLSDNFLREYHDMKRSNQKSKSHSGLSRILNCL